MKSFFTDLKKEDGFTLVELMVVVAIIGVLSAVAIPNFKKYQAKAKVSEAKLQLSSIYTAETSFYADFNIYHNCLRYMGYDPSPEKLSRYYTVGFATDAGLGIAAATDAPYVSAKNSGLNDVQCAPGKTAAEDETFFTAGKTTGSSISSSTDLTGTSATLATATTFVAGAAGVVMNGFTGTTASSTAGSSYLTINQNKVFVNERTGY